MVRKKVNSIEEIWDGKKLIIKDFSNLDLEGLDLSIIPEKEWHGCIFYNTSVKNTKINIDLRYINGITNNLAKEIKGGHYWNYYALISDCDFSENDIPTKFNRCNMVFRNCDFTNTNILDGLYGFNNKLDDNYNGWKGDLKYPPLDIETLKKNPNLKISSFDLFCNITYYLYIHNVYDVSEVIEGFLEFDKEGKLLELWKLLKESVKNENIDLDFLSLEIKNVIFNDITFPDMDASFLNKFKFVNCLFENITFNHNIENLMNISRTPFNSTNVFKNIVIPNVTYSSWKSKPSASRVSATPVTFRTNLYLELGRLCNARCEFCRNSYYCDNTYDFDKIEKALRKVIPKLDSIVIGGGEPSLKLEDLKKIIINSYESIRRNNVGIYLFTNGTHKYIDEELGAYNFKYNISRHAINDEENASIFKLPSKKIMSTEELKWFMYQNPKTTLAATCFNGALDSKQKIIDYIKYASNMGCESILFSDLIVMEDELLKTKENYNFNINSKVFDEVILYLQKKGYEKSIPIYATGGYVLTMLKKGDMNISFKHYISKRELEEKWPKAIKRTFDLSIDPSGNLYENWHQTSGLVKSIKKK